MVKFYSLPISKLTNRFADGCYDRFNILFGHRFECETVASVRVLIKWLAISSLHWETNRATQKNREISNSICFVNIKISSAMFGTASFRLFLIDSNTIRKTAKKCHNIIIWLRAMTPSVCVPFMWHFFCIVFEWHCAELRTCPLMKVNSTDNARCSFSFLIYLKSPQSKHRWAIMHFNKFHRPFFSFTKFLCHTNRMRAEKKRNVAHTRQ